MKITKLFVLGALLFLGNSVAMAADWIARTVPTVSDVKTDPVAFEADHEYLLYNTGAKMFFSQGNSWGTRASGDAHQEHALRMYLTPYVPTGGEWDGKTYIFKNYSNNRKTIEWRECFFDNVNAMFVDRASQANLYWEIQDMGGAKYRLLAAQANPNFKSDGTQFVGRDESVEHDKENLSDDIFDPEAQPLSPMLTEGEGKHVDWVFYDAGIFKTYEKAEVMRAEAEAAEAEGIDISAYVALYNNPNTTAAEFEKATTELQEKRRNNLGNATADNPLSATPFIVNPDFTGNDGKTGWSGDAFGAVNAKDNAEHYNKTYNTYQKVEGLPKGVYALGVNAFYRAGGAGVALTNYRANNEASKYAKLYAFNGIDTLKTSIVSPFKGAPTASQCSGEATASANGVTYYIPNNMESAEYYMHTLGLYANTVFTTVETDSLIIGVRKDAKVDDNDWTIFDDFSLTYYGAGTDAYQKWYDISVDNLDVYAGQEIPANHTKKYTDEYDATFAELRAVKVADKEGVVAAVQAAEEKANAAADALTLNISLWAQFEALIEEALTVSTNSDLDAAYTGPLNVWARRDAPLALQKLEMTNEELQAEVDRITKAIDEARKHPAGDNVDMTNMLTNPGFEDGTTGWTIYNPTGGVAAHGGTDTNKCFEAYDNSNFDIYQVVKNAPKGIYAISVQGFYRYMRDASGYNAYQAQEVDEVKPGKAPVYIYMNDNQTSFTNIYGDPIQITDPDFYVPQSNNNRQEVVDEATGITYYYPNNMSDAAIAFANNMYTQSAYGVVANDGDEMRIGVKGNTSAGTSWAIWDNFKLTFMGFDNKDIVEPILKTALENTKDLVYSPMPNSVKAALETSRANADAALASGNGVDMFNALSALLTANSAANTSIALYAQVQAALEKLADALNVSESTDEVYYAADDLYKDIDDAMQSGEMEDSDVEKALEDIAYWIKQLKVPAYMADASDANPVDCTSLIENPDYASMNNDGWTIKGANPNFNEGSNGLIEVWNSNFDEYQEFDYLPAGTYTVTVQGFYRYGSVQNEYDTYNENPEENNYLVLYALVDDKEYTAEMPRLASDGAEEHTSTRFTDNEETGVRTFDAGDDLLEGDAWQWKWMTEPEIAEDNLSATGIRIANGMIPAANLFSEGKFAGTKVFFTVGDDGKARIGLKKQEKENTYDSWCIWDNWKLTYYGPNSKHDPTAIEDIADKTAVVKTEFFNVSGARVSSTAKGIIIVKETLSNGAVKVKKVAVK